MMPSQDVALIKEGKSSHVKIQILAHGRHAHVKGHPPALSDLHYLLYDLAQKDERGLRGVRKIIKIIIILTANEFYHPSYLLYLTLYKSYFNHYLRDDSHFVRLI